MNNPFVDLRPLIFSEQCVVVSGAGTPEVNGTYLYAAQYNSRPVFYKDRYTIIYWDGSSWVIGANTDDKYFGTATTSPWQATWTRGEGQTPAPFVRQGTAHDFEREIGRRNDPTMRGTAAEKNVGTGPDDVAAGDHTHTPASIGAATASDLATLESSLGTLSQQNADAASITGGNAYFDTLEAATAAAAAEGTLTISATGDILGSGTNRLLGFVAGGATY